MNLVRSILTLIPVLTLFAATPSFEEKKAEIRELLARFDSKTALDRAIALNKQWPDDVIGYELLTAARLGVGDYAEAEKSAQWMIDMRIGKTGPIGWMLIAQIREATGDLDGAIDAINTGYVMLAPLQTAERQALLTYAGELHLRTGKLEIAARMFQDRLKLGPDAASTAALAAVRLQQGNREEATAMLRKLSDTDAHPRYRYQLAEVTGSPDDYAAFEKAAEAIQSSSNNANRELILYRSGHGKHPKEALSLAIAESRIRHDLLTQDALAVAYQANGKLLEARSALQLALDVGTRDPAILLHAKELGLKP